MALINQENYDAGGIPTRFREWLDRLLKNIKAASHNNLNGKQGGTAGEYHHLTSAELANVQNLTNLDSQIGARITLRS